MYTYQLTIKTFAAYCFVALLLSSALPSFASDQQKAEKQCKRMTAMTVDATARTIVSQSMADFLKVERVQLTRERRAMNLSYGSLFVLHQLMAAGNQLADIAAQLQAGQTVPQVAEARHANWHAIADAAKRQNAKIEDDIYKHFLRGDMDKQLVPPDKYNPDSDVVKADNNVTPEEITQARQIYVFWRDRAAPNKNANLDSASQTVVGKSADVFKGGDRPR